MNQAINHIPSHLLREETETVKPKNEMGKHEFMKLLVNQLKNQDPLSPMEHNEFVSQLSQFSSLEELANIDSSIKSLGTGAEHDRQLQAISLIGRDVQAIGDMIDHKKGDPQMIRPQLDEGQRPLRITLYDEKGESVRSMDVSHFVGESANEIRWDGKDNEGKAVDSGKYTFRVLVADKEGKTSEKGAGISGRVTGVTMEGSHPVLMLKTSAGDKTIKMSDILKVQETAEAPANKGAGKEVKVAASDPKVSAALPQATDLQSVDMSEVEPPREMRNNWYSSTENPFVKGFEK